jgi:hypothetical protein
VTRDAAIVKIKTQSSDDFLGLWTILGKVVDVCGIPTTNLRHASP